MSRRKRKTGRKIFIFLLLLAAFGGLGYWSFTNKKEVIISVKTEKVERRDLVEEVVATGRIQPMMQVKISPEVSGEIIELPIKEGQLIEKGALLLKIKPDYYAANMRSAEASHKSSLANVTVAEANLGKAKLDFGRARKMLDDNVGTQVDFETAQNRLDVAEAQLKASRHQTEVAAASLARATEELSKTTIFAPLSGTISQLLTEKGERVVGTATMAGTHVITIADLNLMEARVEIGEMDIVLIKPNQKVRMEVDSFRDQKFIGTVTEIANSATMRGQGAQQEATKFEVRIRVDDKEKFRPGMSVTAYIETRYRTNVITVPIQSVTTRVPKKDEIGSTNAPVSKAGKEPPAKAKSQTKKGGKKEDDKPIEVVFLRDGDKVKMVPVERGISNDDYVEILKGLQENVEIISGGYKAINRELEDGKKIVVEDETPKDTKKDSGS